jgi:inner membrane protein
LVAGLVLSTLYMGWSWMAKSLVEAQARQTLEARGVVGAPMFITPTPLNTLLWRVVVRTDGGYFEGLDSVVANDGDIEFNFYPSDDAALTAAADVPAVARLSWFADGFVSGAMDGSTLVMSDLRMGQHPDYVFRHAVARSGNPHWQAIEPQRIAVRMRTGFLPSLWQRIWSAEPDL